ncbi:hypothetical protein DL93DRAFT_2080537 [Clavulina sp. PMI_390]|nr:hypothetical protein DL93DRAFT_2080537 [Clavulina sp. PMI_390]
MPELHTLSLAMNLSQGRPDDLPLPLAFLQDIINLRQDAAINNVLQRVQPLRSLILSHCSIEEYEWFSGHVNHVVVQPDLGMSVVNSLLMFDRLKVDYTEGAEYWDLSD